MPDDHVYEITDPKTGRTYEASSPRPLRQADIERIVSEGRRQVSEGRKRAARRPSIPSAKLSTVGKLDEFDQTFARGYRPADPALKRWQESTSRAILAPFQGALEAGKLALSSVTPGAGGRLAQNADKAAELLTGLIPLRSELAAGAEGGLGAALETYKRNFAEDPVGQVLSTAGAAGAALGALKGLGRFAPKTGRASVSTAPGVYRATQPSAVGKGVSGALEVIGLPKALMTGYDLSAPGRQGLALTPYVLAKNPKGYAAAWREMLQSAKPGSRVGGAGEVNYLAAVEALKKHPDFEAARASGLELAAYAGDDRGVSRLGEKIPGVGMSQRGYDAFLDRLRLEAFSSMRKSMGEGATPQALSDVARFVNRASGRGELGPVGKALEPLTTHGLFSVKNTAARFQYLNPTQYVTMAPAARMEALKAQLGHVGAVGAALGLAAAGGAQVSTDPTNADFGKVKVGDTRYEVTGGYAPTMRLLIRSLGELMDEKLTQEEKLKRVTRLSFQYTRNVAAPVPGLALDQLAPDFTPPGEKGKSGAERLQRLFIPLFVSDMVELAQREGGAGVLKALPSGLGVGVQTYGKKSYRAPRPVLGK